MQGQADARDFTAADEYGQLSVSTQAAIVYWQITESDRVLRTGGILSISGVGEKAYPPFLS